MPAKVGELFAACQRKLGALKRIKALAKVADVLGNAKAKVGAFFAAVLSGKTWTIVVAIGLTALGGFLLKAPLTELATGKTMAPLKWILTISWLLTAFTTLATGVGILLRVGAFHVFVKIAFGASLPLVGILAIKTVELVRERRNATGSDKEELAPWVTGALEVSGFFVAV